MRARQRRRMPWHREKDTPRCKRNTHVHTCTHIHTCTHARARLLARTCASPKRCHRRASESRGKERERERETETESDETKHTNASNMHTKYFCAYLSTTARFSQSTRLPSNCDVSCASHEVYMYVQVVLVCRLYTYTRTWRMAYTRNFQLSI